REGAGRRQRARQPRRRPGHSGCPAPAGGEGPGRARPRRDPPVRHGRERARSRHRHQGRSAPGGRLGAGGEYRHPHRGLFAGVGGVNPGPRTAVFWLVSAERIGVPANFKENELTHMRPGQPATIAVDAYPGVAFDAKVQSLSPGTGLTFSLLPAENATGNWVKVVQRLPVRVSFDRFDPDAPLHAGLSATVEVDTEHRRPWLDRAARRFAWPPGSTTQPAGA